MTTSARVRALDVEMTEASDTLRGLGTERDRKVAEECRAVRERIDAEYRDRIAAAATLAYQTRKAYEAARQEEALADASGKYPPGTKLRKRARGTWSGGGTVKRGVVEVFKDGDAWPENQRYFTPKPGDRIVRVLKANGTPSLIGEQMRGDELPWRWEVEQ